MGRALLAIVGILGVAGAVVAYLDHRLQVEQMEEIETRRAVFQLWAPEGPQAVSDVLVE